MNESHLEAWPAHLRQSLDWIRQQPAAAVHADIRHVAVMAAGHAAVVADMAAALAAEVLPVPYIRIREAAIPTFVNTHTLLIACDSPSDEIDINHLDTARQRGAHIICVCPHGNLAAYAQAHSLTRMAVPEGAGAQMRPDIWMVCLWHCLSRFGLLPVRFTDGLDEAALLMDRRTDFIRQGAENLAAGLHGKLPLLYGSHRYEPVLRRFAQQINLVARQLAYVSTFPEVIGFQAGAWQHPQKLLPDTLIVWLVTKEDLPVIAAWEQFGAQIVPESGGSADVVLRYGDTPMSQMLYALHFFDWAALCLARENERMAAKKQP